MRLLLIIMLLSIPNFALARQPSCEEMFKNYRQNPFQWVYPEHFYKAEVIELSNKKLPADRNELEFHGLTAHIPVKYTYYMNEKTKGVLSFKSESEVGVYVKITDDRNTLKADKNLYSSAKEFYHKIYTLTPETLDDTTNTLSNLWLIHSKGSLFQNNNDDLKIYKSVNFIAYARTFKGEGRLRNEIIIFHDNLPTGKYLSVGVTLPDENFVEEFLTSLK